MIRCASRTSVWEKCGGQIQRSFCPDMISGKDKFGLVAYCDYLNDDQPYLIDTIHGPIVCVPYSNDINDFNMFARGGLSTRDGVCSRLCFDQLGNCISGPHHECRPATACHRPASPYCGVARVHQLCKRPTEGLVSDPRADRHVVSRRSAAPHWQSSLI